MLKDWGGGGAAGGIKDWGGGGAAAHFSNSVHSGTAATEVSPTHPACRILPTHSQPAVIGKRQKKQR